MSGQAIAESSLTSDRDQLSDTQSLLRATLLQLLDTTKSTQPRVIERYQGAPSASTLAHYKNLNFPIIFRDAVRHWPAHDLWSSQYFRDKMGTELVTVAMTPDGLADSTKDDLFVTPLEVRRPMSDMLDWLRDPSGDVRYLQLQNGSLDLEFQPLAGDVDPRGPEWARGTFGHECLSNIWIGNALSKTSLHHDPYENLYVQVRGQKRFTLYSPLQYQFLREARYRAATYVRDEHGELCIRETDDGVTVPWLTLPDDDDDDLPTPSFQVLLQPGETLYLPALWFHQVEQVNDDEGMCVAVNYWYDLDYDSELWRNWKFVRKVSMVAHGRLEECRHELAEEEEDL
ncbi:protein of unknown function [Taphrina deformans PYCC 5710]|uniref:JmjC domain-containing protein n=1 Tax=Taphrina deformans (strain PYCC 5710 / ATCC 11124 / CBS 356.35 / IMI 108563 / JCM 9778 / NBRC 8474) TaxID=1097556 RepID=R4XIZ2_TAPDE|nr:protein of unknown function [Taphrina deformans PYCC 5710]|eukprot:CCG84454.1 protein of unknown function [Taphrina deformans PYCC 5710]